MNWRSPAFLSVLVIVPLLLIGAGIYFGITRSQPGPQTSNAALPSQSPSIVLSPSTSSQTGESSSGRWLPVPTPAPGQPTPTLPTGALVFKEPFGKEIAYIPSSTTTAQMTWKTYTSQQDGYTIDYPTDWIVAKTIDNGGEGVAFYPPGTDPNADIPGGPKGIMINWIDAYHPPEPSDPTMGDVRSVTVDGVSGQVYTLGALGKAIIAAFPHKQGYLVLTATLTGVTTTDVPEDFLIIDVFQHMLFSLRYS